MSEKRKTYRLYPSGIRELVSMGELKTGDMFSLEEPDGTAVAQGWVVKDPWKEEGAEGESVWGVEVDTDTPLNLKISPDSEKKD